VNFCSPTSIKVFVCYEMLAAWLKKIWDMKILQELNPSVVISGLWIHVNLKCSAARNKQLKMSVVGQFQEFHMWMFPNGTPIQDFILEIEIITTLHHKNIISLIGFCFEDGNLLLVYDFLSRGSLEENIHGTLLYFVTVNFFSTHVALWSH